MNDKQKSTKDLINELDLVSYDDLVRSFALRSSVECLIGSAETNLDCFLENDCEEFDYEAVEQLVKQQKVVYSIIKEQFEDFINAVATRPLRPDKLY